MDLTIQSVIVFVCVVGAVGQNYNCYGDIKDLSPTGEAPEYGGINASHKAIDKDIEEINKRRSYYYNTGSNNCIQPALIAAVASRESDAGLELYKTKGWGDYRGGFYHAYGIMQCDIVADPLHYVGMNCTTFPWDSYEHINAMTKYELIKIIVAVRKKFPAWTDAQTIQGGVAAYNFGLGNVRSWKNLDKGTTHNDYSNDVIARAQWLIKKYGW